MKTSLITGIVQPENRAEFETLLDREEPGLKTTCVDCKEQFAPGNTYTRLGWCETQLSGMCERCFNAPFLAWRKSHEHD